MKVLLINGSPNEKGCTYTALNEVSEALKVEGIETEIFHIKNKPIVGCTGCGACHKSGSCVMTDIVNEAARKVKEADGIIIGSPVYYAAANGSLVSFLNRLFYSSKSACVYKPGAAVASARRSGTTATLDQLNKYFTICNMPVVSSKYWNQVHGNTPEEVRKDKEGLQTMRVLGRNMAWMLKCIEAGKKAGITIPQAEEEQFRTNFIQD